MSQSPDNPQQPSLPLFYKDIKALDRIQDEGLRAHQEADFRFAATTNAIPLVVEEFPFAAGDYPIVFTAGEVPVPVAVTGLELDKNLMIDNEGSWLPRSYVPAYVRRYPFILVEEPQSKQLMLCYESAAPQLSPNGEMPLFENGEPTDVVKRALDFCMALRQQGELTDSFIREVQKHKLLQPGHVDVELADGRQVRMDGFLAIDRNSFMALPADVIADWHQKQWLDMVYAHFLSNSRWQKLAEIAS